MANDSKTKTPPAGKAKAYTIAARTDGFRRCGRAWPAAGVTVAAAELPAEDLAILQAERELVVTEVGGA